MFNRFAVAYNSRVINRPRRSPDNRERPGRVQSLSMSSLIPEKQLVISPSLAATIGLEEAVMLQILSDVSRLCPSQNGETDRREQTWFRISLEQLGQHLPFWDARDLQRVSKSLRDKGVILVDSAPLPQSGELVFAMNEGAGPEATAAADHPRGRRQASSTPAPRDAGAGAGLLAANWQPDEDLLQLLALNHGVPRDFALQQLEDFVLYWRDRQQVSHSWSSKFRQHVLKEWRFYQSRQAAREQQPVETDIHRHWQPSPDAMEILQRAGVSREFIEDAIPEFVLYWRERGAASSTWNSKFIAHIRRQWARYTASLQEDYDPRPIPANWQPNEDVFDILRMANIDADFARQLVPEFVLFWRDAGQVQRSWNTKFLQHVKYQWATRHHFNGQHPAAGNQVNHHAGQQGSHSGAHPSAAGEFRNSPFRQLTDRSWAEGIVDGL